MIAVDPVELVTRAVMGMNDGSFLKIPFYKIIIQFFIGATFIAIIPEDN